MPGQDFIELPDVPPARVVVAPAHHAVHSLMLLTGAHDLSGFNEWVSRTRDALTPTERAHHKLVILGFFHAIVPERNWSSFPAYLDHLAVTDPVALRDRMLDVYIHMTPCDDCPKDVEVITDMEAVLKDADSYLDFLLSRFSAKVVDEEMEREAYTYVADPPAMQNLIVSHLREMWDGHFKAEWDRVEPMLRDSERAFRQLDLSGMSRIDSWRLITGHEMSDEKWQTVHDMVEQIIYVPSAHVGPYVGKLWDIDKLWVLFGARIPEGVQYDAPDLSRAEIVVRLSALADDTRLRLLKLVAEEGELRSQDIMERLGLSQSAASRQLKQLSATGYLNERRCEGAKCYTFNSERLEDTCGALSAFLA